MPPFSFEDLMNTYMYTKDEADKMIEVKLPYTISDNELAENVNDFFSSAQKQLETITAQRVLQQVLPKNMKIFFAGMLGETDNVEDIFFKTKLLYELVMKLNNRPIKLITIYKYMRLAKAAMIMEE